ncbi:13718_t:CDS:2, partial [Cetraspora pellucida]
RNRLPLMPIRTCSVNISQKKTPSTSKEMKPCYYLSIFDIIWNILNNPSLYNTLYFGPEIEVEDKNKYWHGDLWAELPLLGQDKIIINQKSQLWLVDQYLAEGGIIVETNKIIKRINISIVRTSN